LEPAVVRELLSSAGAAGRHFTPRYRRNHRPLSPRLLPATMAHGRFPPSPCDLLPHPPPIFFMYAPQAPTPAPSAPIIGTGASRPDPRCTVAASEIPIAPADRCPSKGFLHWRLSNTGPAALVRVESSVMGRRVDYEKTLDVKDSRSQNRTCRFLAS